MAPPNPDPATLATNAAATDNVVESNLRLLDVFKQIDQILPEMTKSVSALTVAYPALWAAQQTFDSSLYKTVIGGSEELAKIPRLITSEILGANVLLSEGTTTATDAMTRNALAMQKAAYADQEQLTDRAVKIGEQNGKAIYGQMVDYFKSSAELGKTFYESAMGETRLYDASLQAVSSLGQEKLYRMKETSALAAKGLGLDAKDMTAIFQEEFSKTGKISGALVEKFSATILAASKETGLGLRQLTEDSTRMLADVDKFGNMTYSQMTSLSTAIHRLGIDMDDVSRVTEKFTSFENASQAIANIGAVTGATMDTMEMFYLANEDKEEFFRTMRQNLLDQGVTIENLSHQEQVYLSRQLGFNSVRQLQSLLNEEIDFTTGNISDKIADAAEGQEYVGDKLTEQLAQAGGLATETLKAMSPEGVLQRLDAVKKLAGGTSQLFDATVKLKTSLSSMATEGMPALAAASKSFKTGFVLAMDEAIKAGNNLKVWWETFVETAIPKKAQPASVPPMYESFIRGIKIMVGTAGVELDKMPADFKKTFESTSKVALETVMKSSTDAAEIFDKLRKGHEAKIKEISKFEKEIVEEQKARMTEAQQVEQEYKNQRISFTKEEALEKVNEKLGVAGARLTGADRAKIAGGVDTGDMAVLAEVAMAGMAAKVEEARVKLGADSSATAAAPTAPSITAGGSPSATAGASPAGSGTPGVMTVPTTADGNLNIKVKLELDKSDLISMIKADILPDAFDGGIVLKLPKGDYTAGTYKFKLEQA